MSSQNASGGRGGPGGGGARPGSDLENLIQRAQDRVKQFMPTGNPRSAIVLAILVVVGSWRVDGLLHGAE